jgi:hypothetical protein
MIDIAFPNHPFKIEQRQNKQYIFDSFRKRWLILTPEEWVRQNFLQYLVQVMLYPSSLIAVEREIQLGELKKRFDIVVFKESRPWMIVECKEMSVPLSEAVIQQILNYNISLKVQYLVVTNGKQTFAVHIGDGQPRWLAALPPFD